MMDNLFGGGTGGGGGGQGAGILSESYNQTEVTGLGSGDDINMEDFNMQQGGGVRGPSSSAIDQLIGGGETSTEGKETSQKQCDACMAVSGPMVCARVCKGSQNPAMPAGGMSEQLIPKCKGGVCEVKTCESVLNSTGHWEQKCTTQTGVDLGNVRDTIKFGTVSRNVSYDAKITNAISGTFDGVALNVSYDTSSLTGTERENVLGSMALMAGEEMIVNCGSEGCDLCQGTGGCQFEEGSVVKVRGGRVRLPPGSASSPMTMDLAPDATMQIDRDQELLGNIMGTLEVGAGTTTLANISGRANISIGKGARVIFAGSGDSAMKMDVMGELVMSGKTRFTAGMSSVGLLNITGGATVDFAGDSEAVISGEGISSFGKIGVGAAGLRVRGPMRSLGSLNITEGSTMKFEPKDEASIVLAGDIKNISDMAAFKASFKQDVAETLSIQPSIVEISSISDKPQTDRRRRLGGTNKTEIIVAFTIKSPAKNATSQAAYEQIMTTLGDVFTSGKPVSLGGMPASGYKRSHEEFNSVIAGEGLSLGKGAKLQIDAGNVTFEGGLDSDGMVDITTGGRVVFASSGLNTVRGEGMHSAPGSYVEIGKGELRVEGTFTSEGDVAIGAGAKLCLNSSNPGGVNIISGPATKIGRGAELELSAGSLRVDSDLTSEGLFAVKGGGTVDFGKVGGKNSIGGEGMTLASDSTVGVSQGQVSFDSPLVSVGKVRANYGATHTHTANNPISVIDCSES